MSALMRSISLDLIMIPPKGDENYSSRYASMPALSDLIMIPPKGDENGAQANDKKFICADLIMIPPKGDENPLPIPNCLL